MRNYELLEKIWDILHINQARPETKILTIENLLKRERPELHLENAIVRSKELRVVDDAGVDVKTGKYVGD